MDEDRFEFIYPLFRSLQSGHSECMMCFTLQNYHEGIKAIFTEKQCEDECS